MTSAESGQSIDEQGRLPWKARILSRAMRTGSVAEAAAGRSSVERTLEVLGWREDGTEVARVSVDRWWRAK